MPPDGTGATHPARTDLLIGWLAKRRFDGSAGTGGWQVDGSGDITSGFVMINRSYRFAPGFGPGRADG